MTHLMTHPTRTLCVSIARSFPEVYAYVAKPENMPHWAAGLSDGSFVKSGSEWISSSPMGKVSVLFAEKNGWGVVDHEVVLPSGEVNYNALRVIKNAEGSEVLFTLFRMPGVSAEAFEKDASLVQKDLAKLKSILEGQR